MQVAESIGVPIVRLVPYQASFLESFVQWRGQAASVRHNPLEAKTTKDISRMLESEGADISDLRKYASYRWFVEFDGVVVGSVSLKNINHVMSYAEIGYGLGEAYHGRGIATAAVRMLVQKAFAEPPLRKLLAYVHDRNVASCRVLQKLGFTQEGMLREHYIIDGVPENELLFGLLRREWQHRDSMLVRVVAAIIEESGRILITQRPGNVHLAGLWEFPGGKVEANESLKSALVREIEEEIGVKIVVLDEYFQIEHHYPERSVQLHFFNCKIVSGEPQPLEAADLRWVSPEELDQYNFPEADRELISRLRQRGRP